MEEEEHEVYGGEIPDVEGDMDPHNADVDMSAADDDAVKVLQLFFHSISVFNYIVNRSPRNLNSTFGYLNIEKSVTDF
jgi:hypothetical protein